MPIERFHEAGWVAEDISQYVDPKPLSRRPIFLMTCRGELGLPYKTNAGLSGREGVKRGWMPAGCLLDVVVAAHLLIGCCTKKWDDRWIFVSSRSPEKNMSKVWGKKTNYRYWWSNPGHGWSWCMPNEMPTLIWCFRLQRLASGQPPATDHWSIPGAYVVHDCFDIPSGCSVASQLPTGSKVPDAWLTVKKWLISLTEGSQPFLLIIRIIMYMDTCWDSVFMLFRIFTK